MTFIVDGCRRQENVVALPVGYIDESIVWWQKQRYCC